MSSLLKYSSRLRLPSFTCRPVTIGRKSNILVQSQQKSTLSTSCLNRRSQLNFKCIILNQNHHNVLFVRELSMFRKRRLVRMSPLTFTFVFGFAGMICLMVMERIYENYKHSGKSLIDFITGSRQSPEEVKIFMENEKFTTKYATILEGDQIPKYRATRKVEGKFALPNVQLTLFQYQTCPFCCKVRSFLDFYGISYEIVEVNPVMRSEIKFSQTYKKVPILLVRSKESEKSNFALQINDSTLIISALTSYLLSLKPTSRHHRESLTNITRWYLNSQVYKHDDDEGDGSTDTYSVQQSADELVNRYFLMIGDIDPKKYERMDPPLAEERRWRRWADDDLVHILSPNIYRSLDESKRSFENFSVKGDWENCFSDFHRKIVINVGALAMFLVSKSLKRKYALKDDVRESLYDAAHLWTSKGLLSRRFLGGDEPNLADLAVYGNFCAIQGCEAFDDVMKKNATFARWFDDLTNQVHGHDGFRRVEKLV